MQELNLEDILKNTKDFNENKKVGYVAIVWRPNAGKSTFINTLLWEKVSIVSKIPQTTRKKILAIYNDEDSQIIFFDNPWIHYENKIFNIEINKEAISSFTDSDLILYFIDSSREAWEEEKYIEWLLSEVDKPIFKVYTKMDLESKINFEETDKTFKISSNKNLWFEELIRWVKNILPVWPCMFGEDFYTKQDIYFRISEIIREKVFLNTKEEIPHSIFISVESVDNEEKIMKISSYLTAETDSQKYILIWKGWDLITKIWKEARIELEEIFAKKIFLALRVKVRKNWRKDEKLVKSMFS